MEPTSAHDPEPDGVAVRTVPVYSAAGVDLGLIRWFLSLTPAQRLETLQSFVDFAVEARNARETGEVR
jgi:hypothetical protein